MVQRKCLKCNAVFDRKHCYDRHINRKFDCSKSKDKQTDINDVIYEESDDLNQIQNILKKSIQNPKNSKMDFLIPNINCENILNIYKDEKDENEEINNLILCGFCSKSYSSKSNLNKHLKVCKVKKTNDEEKENIFKLLLEKEKQHREEVDELKKQNKLLMDKIDKLINIKETFKSSKSTKSSKITNNNQQITNNTNNTLNNNQKITNNTQNNIVMVNFGKEDLSIIDERQFIERVIKKPNVSGVKIPDEVLKIIHFNPQYPQLSNIYISDINREKCMVYEDGEWKLSNVNNIPQIMDKVCVFSSEQINALKIKYPNNKPLHDRLDVIVKYNNMIDGDYVDDLRDGGRYVEIARCEDFQKHTYNTIKKTLYNEGKKLKKNNKVK